MLNKSYGGPGSFVPTDGSSQSLNSSGVFNMSSQGGDSEASHLSSLPPSLRSSASRPPLYAPHYEQHHHMSTGTLDQLTDDFSELGMLDSRRRESYPVSRTDLCTSCYSSSLSRQALLCTHRPWRGPAPDIYSLCKIKPATRASFMMT